MTKKNEFINYHALESYKIIYITAIDYKMHRKNTKYSVLSRIQLYIYKGTYFNILIFEICWKTFFYFTKCI